MDVGLGEKEIATSRRQGYGRQARGTEGTEGTREIFNRKIGKIAQSETRCMIAIVPPPRDAGICGWDDIAIMHRVSPELHTAL